MARFIATSGTYFDPLSYEELAKPLDYAQERHDAAAEAYDALSAETSALERYISQNEDDQQARTMYNNYMSKLKTLQNNLWNNGISATTKRDLSEARSAYASDILRLQKAVTARQERSKEFWKAKHDHPDLITGTDPSLGGLDNYLNDDNYGLNYYQYSGNSFATAVGTEAKAATADLFRELKHKGYVPGYITRLMKRGATTEEVDNAYNAARSTLFAKTDKEKQAAAEGLTPVEQLLSKVLLSNVESTGALDKANGVSSGELSRLLDYGKIGLSAAVGNIEVKDLDDKVYAYNQQLELAKAKYRMEHPDVPPVDPQSAQDTDIQLVGGENHKVAKEHIDKVLGDKTIRVTKDGKTIQGNAEASELVYSGEDRRKAYQKLGFDIGRDPDAFLQKNFLQGTVVENGQELTVRYNPRATFQLNGKTYSGVVEVMNPETGKWDGDPQRTVMYKAYRQKYEQTLERYKNEDPEIYKAATINPDKQHDLYTEDNIGFNNPLTEYGSVYMNQPQNREQNEVRSTWVARGDTDAGNIGKRVGSWISNNVPLESDDKGKYTAKNIKEWKAFDGQTGHIHEVTKYGTINKKTITDLNEVFDFDNNGNIKNINGILVDPQGLINGYLIINTTAGKRYSVGLDMLSSDTLKAVFQSYGSTIQAINSSPLYTDVQKEQLIDKVCAQASVKIKSVTGYDFSTTSRGGTSKENLN